MDIVVANQYRDEIMNLDADIIKSVNGEYDAAEIGEMFKDFFFDRLIIDVTALKSYDDYNIYKRLIAYIDPDKIVFLLPEGSKLCTPSFLNQLIQMKIYNFTTNVSGVSYLLKKPNTYKEVEHIAKMAEKAPPTEPPAPKEIVELVEEKSAPQASVPVKSEPKKSSTIILGVRNVTASAGATTLIYMMLKELSLVYGQEKVLAIEIDKNDFPYFYDKRMISIKQDNLRATLDKYSNMKVILMDLNGCRESSFCKDIIYLIEPSTLKLNRLIQRNKIVFQSLVGKIVVLNQSILQNNDVFDFESEAGIKIFYNMPPLDERKRNSVIADLLSQLGLINSSVSDGSGKIFGLFRR